MEVVAGTYEEILLGYRLIKVGEKYQFEQSFTDNSHTGCVKSIAISSKGSLASGSTDETIRLFNLKKRSEIGTLQHHSGTVVGLEFFKGNHLFSISEDGTVVIWKYYTWECLKTLRGHKSAVNGISVHPSGKMALTVSKDKTIKTWNLITGKCAFTSNLKSVADLVLWSKDGTYYAVCFPTKIDIYHVQTGKVHGTISTQKRANCLDFLTDDILVYGCEGGGVIFHDVVNNKQISEIDTQTNRIRGLSLVTDEDLGECLFTASSDGYIKFYQITHTQDTISSTLLAEQDSKFRLTCLAVYCSKPTQDNIKTEVKEETVVDKTSEKGNNSHETTHRVKSERINDKSSKKIKLTEETTDVKEEKRKIKTEKLKRAEEKQTEKQIIDKEREAKIKAKKRKKAIKKKNAKKIKL